MRICIDSSTFIRGIRTDDRDILQLFTKIGPDLQLVILRLIAVEVTRNLLEPQELRTFYTLFRHFDIAAIIDTPPPQHLIERYVVLGLRLKGDALIGAFRMAADCIPHLR